MLRFPRLLAFITALSVIPLAHAETFGFLITTQPANSDPALSFTANGTLTGPADPSGPNVFDINAITGSAEGYDFTNVVAPGTEDGFTFDNILYNEPGTPYADQNGFLLELSSPEGTSLAHVYSTVGVGGASGYEVDVIDPNEPGATTPFTITPFSVKTFSLQRLVSPVPEPSTLVLLGTGLFGLAGVLRRRVTRA